jgi:hypothetical protein
VKFCFESERGPNAKKPQARETKEKYNRLTDVFFSRSIKEFEFAPLSKAALHWGTFRKFNGGHVYKPIRRRMVLLALACLAAGVGPVAFGAQVPVAAPAPVNADPMRIDDTFQGTLHIPQANRDLRIVVKITKTDTGALKVVNYSIDQGGGAMTATSASFQDSILKFEIQAIDGS